MLSFFKIFSVNEDGLPCVVDEPPVTENTSEERNSFNDSYVIHHENGSWEIKIPELFTDAFQGHETLTGAALCYAVKELAKMQSTKFYYKCLNKAMDLGLMVKSKDAANRVIYKLNIF